MPDEHGSPLSTLRAGRILTQPDGIPRSVPWPPGGAEALPFGWSGITGGWMVMSRAVIGVTIKATPTESRSRGPGRKSSARRRPVTPLDQLLTNRRRTRLRTVRLARDRDRVAPMRDMHDCLRRGLSSRRDGLSRCRGRGSLPSNELDARCDRVSCRSRVLFLARSMHFPLRDRLAALCA